LKRKNLEMIVVTGAAGFIGSCLVKELNKSGYDNLWLVDDFTKSDKDGNLIEKKFTKKIEREGFIPFLKKSNEKVDFIFHIGARTDTTEFDKSIFDHLNLNYSKALWNYCVEKDVPIIYASSAATYGGGEFGYDDNHEIVEKLKPLNPYGDSKNDFDRWVLHQNNTPPFWAGLKFFNVYGPNEYHKGRMASVIFHAFNQISKTAGMKLFQSHNPNYKNGEQMRDFVYVKDVVSVCLFLMKQTAPSALYNLGSGKARTFLDLVKSTFSAMEKEENISFIPTPEDIRDKYQYFTEANMKKLKDSGYSDDFYSLEEGVEDYVKNYLLKNRYL